MHLFFCFYFLPPPLLFAPSLSGAKKCKAINAQSCPVTHSQPIKGERERESERASHTFKVHFTIAVGVEYVYDPLDQGVLLQFGQGHELLHAQGARVVEVEFLKPLP